MKTGTAPILIFATFSIVGFVALPVSAAKSPAMEACSNRSCCTRRVLEVGDKLTALSKIEKDQQRCQTSQLMVLWTM